MENIFCTLVAILLITNVISLATETNERLATLTIRETRGIVRFNVAVSSGLPFAKGRLKDASLLVARAVSGKTIASQFDVLAR